MSHEPQQYCPNCGAANPLSARVCTNCHEPLPTPEEREQLWSTRHEAPLPLQTEPAQPAPTPPAEPAGQVPFAAPPPSATPPPPSRPTPPPTTPGPTWGAATPPAGPRFDQTRVFPTQPPSGPPPGGIPVQRAYPAPPPPPVRTRRTVSGWLLGFLAILIIIALIVILGVVLATQQDTGSALRGQLENVAATEAARIGTLPIERDGTLTVTDQQLNNAIQRYSGEYGPLNDPEVEILPDVVRVSFDVFGMRNSYQAGVRIVDGELELVNVNGSTVADAVLPAGDVATIVEDTVRTLQQRSNVRFTAVELGDGRMTFTTVPIAGTPVAGTARAGTPTAQAPAEGGTEPTIDLSSAATRAVGGTVQSLPGNDNGDRVPTATATSATRTATTTSQRATSTPRTPTPTNEAGIKISD